MKHKTFNSAANSAMLKLEEAARTTLMDKKMFEPITTYITNWVASMTKGDSNTDDLELATMVLERAGIQSLQYMAYQGRPINHQEMVELLCKKQHDYGHKNISNFGVLGLAVRIADKIARIENLEKRSSSFNEPLVDSFVDIVGYAMIAVMLSEETFMLPLEGDKND